MAGIIEVKDQGKVRIYDADNSNYIDIVVPSTVSSNRTITIPDATFTIPQETNATHSGEVTGSGALTIADNVVDEANLKVSNSPTNGYALTAQSGNTGGLTWAAAGLDGWSSNSGNLLPADASKGIYLGVNSATAANLLDDYEEGTWTPTFTNGGSSLSNVSVQKATYTKIGRMVWVEANVQYTGSSVSGGYIIGDGLPFTSAQANVIINGTFSVHPGSGDSNQDVGAAGSHDSNTNFFMVPADLNNRYLKEWTQNYYLAVGFSYFV